MSQDTIWPHPLSSGCFCSKFSYLFQTMASLRSCWRQRRDKKTIRAWSRELLVCFIFLKGEAICKPLHKDVLYTLQRPVVNYVDNTLFTFSGVWCPPAPHWTNRPLLWDCAWWVAWSFALGTDVPDSSFTSCSLSMHALTQPKLWFFCTNDKKKKTFSRHFCHMVKCITTLHLPG